LDVKVGRLLMILDLRLCPVRAATNLPELDEETAA
jgi:hypothetical protein